MIHFAVHSFAELDADLLYRIVRRREEVFVVEQECAYLDADGHDRDAWHVIGFDDGGDLVAYARILPPGATQADHPSIGRVLTVPSVRGHGVGRALMEWTLAQVDRLFAGATVKISAQTHLEDFYVSLGFRTVGDGYLEDGIPHVAMVREPVG